MKGLCARRKIRQECESFWLSVNRAQLTTIGVLKLDRPITIAGEASDPHANRSMTILICVSNFPRLRSRILRPWIDARSHLNTAAVAPAIRPELVFRVHAA